MASTASGGSRKSIRKAIFPVGGLGTRFLPATKAMPKEMLPVVDKPLIQYAVEEALAAGIEQLIFVTGRGKSAIEDHFDYSIELNLTLEERGKTRQLGEASQMVLDPGQISYIRQQKPEGLGHAVWCARHFVQDNEPVAILLADDLVLAREGVLSQMVEAYNELGGNLIAVMDVPPAHTARYGILDCDDDGRSEVPVRGLVEKPDPARAPSTLAVIGRYILQPSVFRHLDSLPKGAGGEIQLTDAMARMIPEAPFHGVRFEGQRFDCGDKVGFLEANLAFALDREDMAEELRGAMTGLMHGGPS